ncbi:SET domain protein 16 isoform 1 [Hibiscus syriacus]|uniref:SET domain protein 16 isoform 1 n=1 Tax=Hibiscus syriacus TaxID=106335 RepID=A0A6A3BTT4_HIBSY|nr:SET domain protein 16 isoform 1 [Hibiscus syriacus]
MVELLSRDDFMYVDPNGDRFEWLLQIAKFEEDKLQENHDDVHSKGFEYNARLHESLCGKENMGFDNNAGKKPKRKLKEEDGDGEWGIIQKTLFSSDVNHTASRFSVPFSQVRSHDFLTKTEADDLAHKKPMQVCFLDPSMKKSTMTFNRWWKMRKNSLYVMIESWNSVVESNKQKKGEIVQLWSLRVNSNLCFALVRV